LTQNGLVRFSSKSVKCANTTRITLIHDKYLVKETGPKFTTEILNQTLIHLLEPKPEQIHLEHLHDKILTQQLLEHHENLTFLRDKHLTFKVTNFMNDFDEIQSDKVNIFGIIETPTQSIKHLLFGIATFIFIIILLITIIIAIIRRFCDCFFKFLMCNWLFTMCIQCCSVIFNRKGQQIPTSDTSPNLDNTRITFPQVEYSTVTTTVHE
jgi:hypothetical protein